MDNWITNTLIGSYIFILSKVSNSSFISEKKKSNVKKAFEDDFMSNMTINKNIVPMQHWLRSKTCAKVELLLRYARIWAWTSWTWVWIWNVWNWVLWTVNTWKAQFLIWTVKIIMRVMSLSLSRIEARVDAKNILWK